MKRAAVAFFIAPLAVPLSLLCWLTSGHLARGWVLTAIVIASNCKNRSQSYRCEFHVIFPCHVDIQSDGPSTGGVSWGRPWGRAVGGTGTKLMWVRDPPPPLNSL